jgi:phosphoribosylanthranilate isomerase
MWVKICALSTMKAALAAYEAGADALGFVLAPSRRQIDPDRAHQLIQGLPDDCDRVGLFVNEKPEEVNRIARYAGFSAVQLHGDEPPAYLAEIELPVIKAIRVRDRADLARIPAYRGAAAILIEPHVAGVAGGAGIALPDWRLLYEAAEVMRQAGLRPPLPGATGEPGAAEAPLALPEGILLREVPADRPLLLLAGGLTPENVAEATQSGRPDGVDVSSGVEVDGQKSIDRIYHFIEAAKGAGR